MFDRWIRAGRMRATLAAVALLSAASLATIAEVERSAHPFKRNGVVPFQEIFDFVDRERRAATLVMSTDPVVYWVLAHRGDRDLCAIFVGGRPECLDPTVRYDTVILVSGHSDRIGKPGMARFERLVQEMTAGRARAAVGEFGVDEDAALKTRLSGVPLTRTILTGQVFR